MATHSVIGVDWSGATANGRSRTWLAEASRSGELARLEAGRDRIELVAELLRVRTQVVAIGLDFAFSFPAWYTEQLGVCSAPELWALVAERGEGWLAQCEPPFWGRRGRRRPTVKNAWRRTELAVPRTAGIGPKSIFQIGGAGSVGTGSMRGMPLLHQLGQTSVRVWPFTDRGSPVVVEIYPRLLTGVVRKSDAGEREHYLARHYPSLEPTHVRLAIDSEDAFDAAVSALVMVEHVDDLATLPPEPDPVLRLEGRIWHPGWRDDPIIMSSRS
jgi:Protein of unknown function (DUF429)